MKGIIQATALFILMLGISLGFMAAIRYDTLRYVSQRILKQAITETLLSLAELPPAERAVALPGLLEASVRLRQPVSLPVRLSVLGFMADPLALRVRLEVIQPDSTEGILFRLEETMIEVNP